MSKSGYVTGVSIQAESYTPDTLEYLRQLRRSDIGLLLGSVEIEGSFSDENSQALTHILDLGGIYGLHFTKLIFITRGEGKPDFLRK